MSLIRHDRKSLLLVCGLLLGGAVLATAQPRRTSLNRAPTRKQEQPAPLTFGDIKISRFRTASVDLATGVAVAEGPETTVETLDPKQPNAKSRLQANKITAYLVPKSIREVERAEAEGNVRFSATRPMEGGIQTLNGTGSKGTYFKKQGRLTLAGPVRFDAEQPTADGKAKQSVTGTASELTYDEEKEVVTFNGRVKAEIMVPGLIVPATVNGDLVRVEMSKRPYAYQILNNDSDSGSVNFRPKPPEKKPDKKPN